MLKTLLRPRLRAKELAQEYGCSESYISMVLHGKRKPSTRFKLFCAEKFGLPVSVIFPNEGVE